MKIFASSRKIPIFCLQLLILQSAFYSNFFVNSIPSPEETKNAQKPEDPKHKQKDIKFALHLVVPIDLKDDPTIAYVSSAKDAPKHPTLHYNFPKAHPTTSVSGFLTDTDGKIKEMPFGSENKETALRTSISFSVNNPKDQYIKRVGMYLIEGLLSKSQQQNHQKGPDEEHLKRLDAKLTQSGLHGELPTTNTGGDFQLDVFGGENGPWKIVLKHETLRLVNAQIGEDTVELVIQAVTGPQKMQIKKPQLRVQVPRVRVIKKLQLPPPPHTGAHQS